MARRLKTYQTSSGFFDLAVAAPSMKAAAEAWGSRTNVFKQGFAKETRDPAIVAATMAKPGVVLRRPVGSNGPSASAACARPGMKNGAPNSIQRQSCPVLHGMNVIRRVE